VLARRFVSSLHAAAGAHLGSLTGLFRLAALPSPPVAFMWGSRPDRLLCQLKWRASLVLLPHHFVGIRRLLTNEDPRPTRAGVPGDRSHLLVLVRWPAPGKPIVSYSMESDDVSSTVTLSRQRLTSR
jgi:hypothetical protein